MWLQQARRPLLHRIPEEDVVSMADSTITVEDIEGELFKIERIKDALVRKESELRYIISLKWVSFCNIIIAFTSTFAQMSFADKDKSNEDRQHEEELLQQIQKLVETRDFLVDDMEFERLRSVLKSRRLSPIIHPYLTTAVTHTHLTSHSQMVPAALILRDQRD
uniref:Zgc:171844 n=1 Tax=Sinocyclocheilus grahami TaxID=75366 RepID=A0A672RBA7_SINGR